MRVPPVAAFTACTLIWGTTWIAIKIGYEGLDPLWGGSLRFLLASLLLLPALAAGRFRVPIKGRPLGVILAVGLILFGVDYGLIYWGEQFIDSGLTAILFATTPFFVALHGAILIPAERVTIRHVAGVLVGLAGLGLIFGDQLRFDATDAGPMVAIVGAAFAAGLSSVIVRRWGADVAPLVLNQGAMLVGGVALLLVSLGLHETPSWPTTQNAWLALLFLVLFGSIVAFLLYWDLLRRWGHHRASLITLLIPVVAVVTGLVVGEQLSPWQWAGSAGVLGGVALALWPAAVRATPAVAPAAK